MAEKRIRVDEMSLVGRLRLIAAWQTPGGPTPSLPQPTKHITCNEAADEIERLEGLLKIYEARRPTQSKDS